MLNRQPHRFLFIHIPKVAGLSVSAAFESAVHGWPKCLLRSVAISVAHEMRWRFISAFGDNDGLRRWESLKTKSNWLFSLLNLYPPHVTALDWRQKLGPDAFNGLFKFTFVRNPWDREVSMYHYILQDRKNPQHAHIKSLGSFEEYLKWTVATAVETQKSYLTDNDSRLLVDFVGRFEHLADDLQHVCRLLQLNNVRLPKINTSKHELYQSYYNASTRKLVEQHFQDDITTFGYTFDDAPSGPAASATPMPVAGPHYKTSQSAEARTRTDSEACGGN